MILCSCWGWKIAMSTVLWRFPSPMGKSDSISSKEMPYSFSNAFAINWRTCSLGVSLTGRSPVMQSMIFPSPRIASLSVSSGATGSLSGDTMTSSSIVLLTPYLCVMVRPHLVLYLFCSIYIALFVCDASKRLSQSSLSVKLCIGQSQHLYSFSVSRFMITVSRFMITVSRFPKSYIHKMVIVIHIWQNLAYRHTYLAKPYLQNQNLRLVHRSSGIV